MLAAMLALLSTPADAAKGRKVRRETALPPLAGLTAELRKAGVEKVFIGVAHGQPGNIRVTAEVLQGAASVGPLTLWRESFDESAPGFADMVATFDQYFLHPGNHAGSERLMLLLLKENQEYPLAEESKLAKVLASPSIEFRQLVFTGTRRRDMSKMLADPGFAVGSMGYRHVESEFRGPGQTALPWDPTQSTLPRIAATNPEVQRDMQGGFWRAPAGTAVSLRVGSLWEPMEGSAEKGRWTFERSNRYHNAKGNAVVELPLQPGLNVSLALHGSLVPALRRYLETAGWEGATWWCGTIEGCPDATGKAESPHDEL